MGTGQSEGEGVAFRGARTMARTHQGLTGYLGHSTGPPTFGVPSEPLHARLPLGPNDSIPAGIRPIPASSQAPKKTNAQIPYVRLVFAPPGTGGRHIAPVEGDVVMVEQLISYRKHEGARLGHDTNSYAYARTIESINSTELAEPRESQYSYETFPWRLDGVINNVDSEDSDGEFRDYTIANVAIYGPCRLDHRESTRCDFKTTHPGSVIYIGLEVTKVDDHKFRHQLVRFSSAQIARGVHKVDSPGRRLVCAWTLGRMVDSNQSKDMVTIHVDISPVYDIVVDPADTDTDTAPDATFGWPSAASPAAEAIVSVTANDQLKQKWDMQALRAKPVPPSMEPVSSASWH